MSNQTTHSRGSCICDHCGKKINRHNLKKHVTDIHPGKPVRERIVGMLSFDKFVSKFSNTANKNEETIATIDNPVVEPEVEPELAPEVELEAPFKEEGIITLDGINKQMKINQNAIIEKLGSIQ